MKFQDKKCELQSTSINRTNVCNIESTSRIRNSQITYLSEISNLFNGCVTNDPEFCSCWRNLIPAVSLNAKSIFVKVQFCNDKLFDILISIDLCMKRLYTTIFVCGRNKYFPF